MLQQHSLVQGRVAGHGADRTSSSTPTSQIFIYLLLTVPAKAYSVLKHQRRHPDASSCSRARPMHQEDSETGELWSSIATGKSRGVLVLKRETRHISGKRCSWTVQAGVQKHKKQGVVLRNTRIFNFYFFLCFGFYCVVKVSRTLIF